MSLIFTMSIINIVKSTSYIWFKLLEEFVKTGTKQSTSLEVN